ncbi:MerR family transcriptional regulator [bacterium]|nr:MAG: MerR family transcriptional regulator [bacterium]
MSSGENGKALKLRKLFYSISEVSKLTGIPAHVLRYWEGEFTELSPKKGRNGSRLYQEKDLNQIREIKELLYEKKFTISGARKQLKSARQMQHNGSHEMIDDIRHELKNILKLLDK